MSPLNCPPTFYVLRVFSREKGANLLIHAAAGREKGTETTEGQEAAAAGGGALPLETRKPTAATGLGGVEGRAGPLGGRR